MGAETLYLVDGSGYIYRAYYAIAPLSNSKGLPTNAVFGFWRMLEKLLRDVAATHIAVAFDTPTPTFRHKLYEEYKANRAECPEDLVAQMPYFRRLAEALGIRLLEKPGFEADDLIATVSDAVAPERVVVVSGDKDLCQLVSPRVEVWDAMRDIHYDRAGVIAKFGLPPERLVDYLTLVGDSSDNVPGVRGVGPKTAVQLLEHFGSLDDLLARLDELPKSGVRGAAALKEKFATSRDAVRLSRELVTLLRDVEPYYGEKRLDCYAWPGPNEQQLTAIALELEFNLQSVRGASARTVGPERKCTLVTAAEWEPFLAALKQQSRFAFDVETTSLVPEAGELLGIGFSWQAGEAYYLPLGGVGGGGELLDRALVLAALRPIFCDRTKKKVGSNLKFDAEVLEARGVAVDGLGFDTMLASYVLNPDRRQHGLKQLAKVHLNETMTTYEELVKKFGALEQVPLAELAAYCGADAEVSLRLADLLGEKLGSGEKPSLRYVFEQIEMPLVPVLAAMEQAGIKIDLALLDVLGAEFAGELADLEQEIYRLAGTTFNLNSPKQLSSILFERLGLPTAGIKKTQTALSTDASVLEKLAAEYEIAAKVLEYREIFKLKSTYVDALRTLVRPESGRIHTSFNQSVAATGRLSSSEPNLQNIPIRNPRGRRLREAFIAEEGAVLISADYSQIELRVLAHLSGDKGLIAAFRADEDIHLATARELLGQFASEQELKDLRRVAKTINFGVVYGMSAFRLAGDLGISRREAQKFIDSYFARYPGVRRYFDEVAQGAAETGYVETLFGRRRYLRDIDSSGRDSGYTNRSAMNAPIQGTAAEIMKLAMIRVFEKLGPYGRSARMLLQVHDELVIEADKSTSEEVRALIVQEMQNAVELAVPLKVDVRLANKWG